MTITHRRIIYSFFIFCFLVILPLIYLEALGYKYNFKQNSFQKTGIIFIESKPKDVEVYLNGELVDEKTPTKIDDLLPNSYDLKIEKQGYFSWHKKVKVLPDKVSSLQYIRLFKKDQDIELVAERQYDEIAYNYNANLLAAVVNDPNKNSSRIDIFESNQDKLLNTYKINSLVNDFYFSDFGERLIVYTTDDGVYKINTRQTNNLINVKNLLNTTDGKLENLKVDKFNSKIIEFIADGKYHRFNTQTKQALDYPIELLNYVTQNNQIYFIKRQGLNNLFLNKGNLNSRQYQKLTTLQDGRSYNFKIANDDIIILQDSQNNLIIWQSASQTKKIISSVEFAKWDRNMMEMIYGTGNELWVYRPLADKFNDFALITRSSQGITSADWFIPNTHIFYSTPDKLKLVENFIQNRLSLILKDNLVDIKNVVFNESDGKIYFTGALDSQEGLFSLAIVD